MVRARPGCTGSITLRPRSYRFPEASRSFLWLDCGKIRREGVTFASHIETVANFMGPQESMRISYLCSDIAMAFDECVEIRPPMNMPTRPPLIHAAVAGAVQSRA